MSRETAQWLNTMTLIGFTGKRGKAWHYRADVQGDESNHYDGAIPVEDVKRRLFHWAPVEMPVFTIVPPRFDLDGVHPARIVRLDGRKAVLRDDELAAAGIDLTGLDLSGNLWDLPGMDAMGMFKDSYQPHPYHEWLVLNVERILDGNLSIGSAGLLRGGAQAWVSVEVPDNITTPEGVEFRPNLLACTSFDGSLATTYKRHVTVVVCDNTLSIARGENGQQYKVKHTSKSLNRITDAREALNIVYSAADDFAAEVAELCRIDVSDKAWAAFMNEIAPLPEDPKNKRGATMAENKRAEYNRLWNHDARVSPWQNTAYGVLAAVNTYDHHIATTRGMSRADRNMDKAVSGDFDKLDRSTLATLTKVLATV
ncbi:DUF932 domain-containing protein [Streptosporangium sp. NPDC050855]|uniref:DUF932 domain-containing protein n=1 Tax=Streptosporangium sp. NPDC050855 TaxID=3366194 RepID=UPI003792AF37